MTYNDKLEKVANDLIAKNGSFSAGEVHDEMRKRGWLIVFDSVLDTHKLLTEIFEQSPMEIKERDTSTDFAGGEVICGTYD